MTTELPDLPPGLLFGLIPIVLVSAYWLLRRHFTMNWLGTVIILGLPVAVALAIRSVVEAGAGFEHRHAAAVTDLAISPDERYAITGDSRGDIRVIDLATGNVMSGVRASGRSIKHLAMFAADSPEVTFVDSGGDMGSVQLAPSLTGGWTVSRSTTSFYRGAMQFARLGNSFLMTTNNANGYVLHRVDWRTDQSLKLVLPDRPTTIATSPYNDATVALGFANGTVGVARISGDRFDFGVSDRVESPGSTPITAVAYDGGRIASVDQNGAVILWSVEEGKGLRLVQLIQSAPLLWDFSKITDIGTQNINDRSIAMAVAPDGSTVAVKANSGEIAILDAVSGVKRQSLILSGDDTTVTALQFSPNGEQLVTGSNDGTARLWDTTNGRLIAAMTGHSGTVFPVSFSPDGNHIIAVAEEDTARLWDAASGRQIATLNGHTRWIYDASFSPDGKQIITTSSDNTARLWDSGGNLISTLAGHEDLVNSAEFSPDGTRIATASDDQTVRIWDGRSEAPLLVLRGHNGSVQHADFSPDGASVLSASDDAIVLWDASSGKEIGSFPLDTIFAKHWPVIAAVTHGEPQGVITLRDVSTGHAIAVIPNLNGDPVSALEFLPSGDALLGVTQNGSVNRWSLADFVRRCLACIGLHFKRSKPDGPVDRLVAVERSGRIKTFNADNLADAPVISHPPTTGRVVAHDAISEAMAFAQGDGPEIVTPRGAMDHDGDVVSHIAVLKDGRVVSASLDGTVKIVDPGMHEMLDTLDFWPKVGAWVSDLWIEVFPPPRLAPPPAALPQAG